MPSLINNNLCFPDRNMLLTFQKLGVPYRMLHFLWEDGSSDPQPWEMPYTIPYLCRPNNSNWHVQD